MAKPASRMAGQKRVFVRLGSAAGYERQPRLFDCLAWRRRFWHESERLLEAKESGYSPNLSLGSLRKILYSEQKIQCRRR
jgi:hypothetical protein